MTATFLPVLTTGRSCGECDRCCYSLGVELDGGHFKPNDMPCRYRSKPGCSLHGTDDKPGACRIWHCRWVMGWGEESDRPDKLGLILLDSGEFMDAYGGERARWPHLYPMSERAQGLLERSGVSLA